MSTVVLGMTLLIGFSGPTAPAVHATDPEPFPGDLVVQFGAVPCPSCGESQVTDQIADPDIVYRGNDTDRIDILDGRNGTTKTQWATGYPYVYGIDASRGDGVTLAVSADPVGSAVPYGVHVQASDGTVDETWSTTEPDELSTWRGGVAETDTDPPVFGGVFYDGEGLTPDVFQPASSTSASPVGVVIDADPAPPPLILGATDTRVAYRDGQSDTPGGVRIKVSSLSTGATIWDVPAPFEMLDGRLADDQSGVFVTPGHTSMAEFISFLGVDQQYDAPETDCPPVSVDAGGQWVYVLVSCPWGDAEILQFDRDTGAYFGVLKTYSHEDLEIAGSYPARLRVYGAAAPGPTPIIFVHGFTQLANVAANFPAVLDDPILRDNEHAALIQFSYWQDADTNDV